MAATPKQKLIIVESPAKARTISKFLGKGYKVEASQGHVRDLPKSQIGVDITNDFDLKYITIRGRGDILARIRKEAKSASTEERVSYRVKSGDYLGRIASRYGVTVTQLKNWNHLRSTNLRVGQVLYIYRGGSGPKTTTTTTNTTTTTSKTSSTTTVTKPATTTNSSGQKIYTVKSGDSLYSIAKNYSGVSADNIKAANGLKSNNIKPGQKLIIPAGSY